MSSDPTETPPADPTPTPDAAGGPATFIDFVAGQRLTVAWVLLAVGLACLAATVFCGYRYANPPGAATVTPPEADDPAADVAARPPRQPEFVAGALAGVLGAMAGIGFGGWLMAAVPKPSADDRRREARTVVLLAGGLFGLGLMVLGSLLFYLWFDDLTAWVDRGKVAGAKWPLLALLVFLLGAGLTFLSAQPARAEERSHPVLRRLVYGTNLGLAALLLVVLLTVGNVFAALRLPARLDTTESGLHTVALSDPTREYLAGLGESVQVFATLPPGEDAQTLDTRRLLDEVEAANPARVDVRYLDQNLNKTEIAKLKNDYPRADLDRYGILLTVRGDEKRSEFVRLVEMVKTEPVPGGDRPRTVFQGEALFARALLALTETKSEPVVYVTRGAGELDVTGGTPDAGRPAGDLKTALSGINCVVKPLEFGAGTADPKIPDDAAIVAVADPLSPLSDRTVGAIREFMTRPHGPDKKAGRLIVLAGAHANPAGGGGVMPTGLEGLLSEFGIELEPKALYGDPDGPLRLPADTLYAQINPSQARARNPIALSYGRQPLLAKAARPVRPAPPGAAAGPQAEALAITVEDRVTWAESGVLGNPEGTWMGFSRGLSGDVVRAKDLAIANRPVAAIASDDAGGRVVVYGFADFFTDETSRQLRGKAVQADLFAASVNWLRDRPAVANIPSKAYGEYTLDRNADTTRLFWLPVGLCLLAIMAVGLGVLVLRRA